MRRTHPSAKIEKPEKEGSAGASPPRRRGSRQREAVAGRSLWRVRRPTPYHGREIPDMPLWKKTIAGLTQRHSGYR